MLVWRPVTAGLISIKEVKLGFVSLVDLLKINAILDMKSDIEKYYLQHPPQKDGGKF